MNREQAKRLIIDTFENPFDKGRFSNFIANLLKTYDREKALDQRAGIQGVTERFLGFISSWERLGRYIDEEGNKIDILIVKLRKDVSLYRARSTQRNFVAYYLQGKLGTATEKDAALVAFVSPDEQDWRFSLVKMEYKLKKTPTGKTKVEEEPTPAKRWSFLVGPNEKSHTAQSRFLPILENDNFKPKLSDLEKAFDVEVVTEEFFEKYRDLFIRTKLELDKIVNSDEKVGEEFRRKNISTIDFAKKLLGQIVFLYFLQKKGWFGVERGKPWGTGPKDFLRRLFNKEYGDYENFYNDILEPLFYEALRTDRAANGHYYYRFKCKIPFLNGGLFDPPSNFDWVNVDLLLPNELFSNKNRTKEGDIGDGILDIFDRYNFTVNEEEDLEKEVALDPELLGKIYEKLNAIREDNLGEYIKVLKSGKKGEETKFNKEYGVYYTPREIVRYMCQESLIDYLETELNGKVKREDIEKFVKFGDLFLEHERLAVEKREKIEKGEIKGTKYEHEIPESIVENAETIYKLLDEIKICDPAVGSGAFPIGMLHEIVKLKQLLSIYLGKYVSTYDLKRYVIENSLYGVDIDPGAVEICKLRFWLSLVVDEDDFENIKPLPNLDYKVVCGDSLLGVVNKFKGISFWDNEDLKKIEDLESKYRNETNALKRQSLKEEIDKLIFRITKGEFSFEVYFFRVFREKGGFDVVIGNPPYGAKYTLKHKEYFMQNYITAGAERESKKDGWASKYSLDSYALFIERGFSLLKTNGNLIFIVPISITSSDSVESLQYLLEKNCKVIKISSYAVRPQPVFQNSVVNTSIISFIKTLTPAEKILCTKMYRKSKDIKISDILNNLEFIDVKEFKLKGRYPKISYQIEKDILRKIFDKNNIPIGNLIRSQGKPIYYRTSGGRYFKIVTNYPTGSTKEKALYFDKDIADIIGAILSSNLFFWFYQIYSNNLDLKLYDISIFCIPYKKLLENPDLIKKIEEVYNEYLSDIEKNAIVKKTTQYKKIKEFKEYRIRKSKHIIDKIDDLICPLYGMTEQEIDFIKNYEIKFRLSEEDSDDE
jgi:hypothetical protein